MAPSVREESSSNSSNSTFTSKWNFHVFLSFMGQDTRRNFTDYLYAALHDKGIIVFRDDKGIERGEIISQQLVKAIEDSLFAIVILSKNFAFSTWCLDELQKILESRKELGRQVFPIFYGVDPSDVRHQQKSFDEALKKHKQTFRRSKVQRWRDALTEVANLSGWDSKGWNETDLIKNIVLEIWTNLCSKLQYYDDNLVGIDSRMVKITSLLGIGVDDVRFVGIWGMGGIGKTTLARAVYEIISSQFEICCFLANVRETSDLQTELLSHMKIHEMKIKDTHEGKKIIRNLFCNKKVLLVLDDVDGTSQLENLAESPKWFGAGSRVIITTRNIRCLKSHGVYGIYKIEIMKKDESLQLFSKKAFKKDHPEEDYLELSKSVVEYARGLPLALKVLGSFLCGRNVLEWKDALNRLKKIPNKDILQKLRISYDGLEDDEKTIFLDIACFFKGWKKDQVTQILENCGLHPTIGISILIEKALLIEKIDWFGDCCLEMHDLLQELGRSIVFQEYPYNACRRSRLWNPKDINEVLKNNKGTEAIQGIVLPIHYEAHIDPKAFSKMCNLRLLIISNEVKLPRGLKCLSSALKVIKWTSYPLEALPVEIPLDKLIDIQISNSKIRQLWNGIQCLEKLKSIDLSYSQYLTETPNFSGVPNLERLILQSCTSLVEVHSSLGELKKLVELDLGNCENLEILPGKLKMNSLTKLVLHGCSKVKKLPEFGKRMKNLLLLDLKDTVITELPESIEFLTRLEYLNLRGCKNLVCLPCTLHKLKHLSTLNICECTEFSMLPENLNENEALENLDVSMTHIKEVPLSILQLENLKTLSLCGFQGMSSRHLGTLRLIMGSYLPSLTELDLSYCGISDGSIPHDIGGLSSLFVLNLGGNNFVNLPAGCISNLSRLHYLFLNSCERLKSLPKLPPLLIRLDTFNCNSMEPLSDGQLWNLFSSLDHLYRRRTKYMVTVLKRTESEYLPQRDFFATIPGSEIPSWFPNKVYTLSRDRKDLVGTYVSIMVDIPQSCGASEWSGIAVCLKVLCQSSAVYISWTSKAPEDDIHIRKEWAHSIRYIGNPQIPQLCLMLLHCNDQTCWQHLRGDNNRLEIKFRLAESTLLIDALQVEGCGWRVLCKEEMEERRSKHDFNKLWVAEVGNSEVWVPHSVLNKTLKFFGVLPNQLDRKRKRKRKREE